MPLNKSQLEIRKRVYNDIRVDSPIDPSDPRYVPIYENSETDPIRELMSEIELLEVESTQFFSGFRGSGKSTQLRRLKSELENENHFVLMADALDYLNPAVPLDIATLLIVISGAFGDALQQKLGSVCLKETYWQRFYHFLSTTNIELTEFGMGAKASGGLGDISGNLKFAVKETASFRSKIREVMSTRLKELKDQVDLFIKEGVEAIQKREGKNARIVFIFDSLEQIRGSYTDAESILKSVEEVFTQHVGLLKLNFLHTIYTVPPWLRFVLTSEHIVSLRSIKQWHNDLERTRYDDGNDLLQEVVEKRFGNDGMGTFFGVGDERNRKIRSFVDNCGGSLRQLLRMLSTALLRVREAPFSDAVIDGAISDLMNSFVISDDDAVWLSRIAEKRTESLKDSSTANINRLTRLIDTHLVLYFRNGSDWYDVHPLVRRKIEKILVVPIGDK